jgi:ABC-type multidrug transport system ATPase subunit
LALARVFLKDPPVLILDEATAALDTLSERRVVQSLVGGRGRDRTVILVAHRLSTLRHADRVVVFEDGRVAEIGPYQELVRRGGLFTELVRVAGDNSEVVRVKGCGVYRAAAGSANQGKRTERRDGRSNLGGSTASSGR